MVSSKRPPPTPRLWKMPIGFHQGNAILFLASHYGELDRVIKEVVQNSLDAKSLQSVIVIDLQRKKFSSYDWGEGSSREGFQQRFAMIAQCQKGAGDIGQKGIGNLAALAVGRIYRIITRDQTEKPPGRYFELKLDRQLVEDQPEVEFEGEEKDEGFVLRYNGTPCSTFLQVRDLNQSAIRDASQPHFLTDLADDLGSAYRAKLRATKAKITIILIDKEGVESRVEVMPLDYPGRREIVTIDTPKGPVTFEMYMTFNRVKKPQVMVEHQGVYSLPLVNIKSVWSAVAKFFGSGYIQGTIRLKFGTVDPDRTKLLLDDDLVVFDEAVQRYVEEYGQEWLETLQNNQRLAHYGDLANQVIDTFAQKVFGQMPELIDGLVGALGGDVVGPVSVIPPPPRPKRKKPSNKDVPRLPRKPVEPRGPRKKPPEKPGNSNTVRVTTSAGITVLFREADAQHPNTERIRLGTEGDEKGCVVFNITNRHWIDAEAKGEVYQRRYMASLLGMILSTRVMDEEASRKFRDGFENIFLDLFLEPVIGTKN